MPVVHWQSHLQPFLCLFFAIETAVKYTKISTLWNNFIRILTVQNGVFKKSKSSKQRELADRGMGLLSIEKYIEKPWFYGFFSMLGFDVIIGFLRFFRNKKPQKNWGFEKGVCRIWTGDKGVADPCLTTWLSRHILLYAFLSEKWLRRESNPCYRRERAMS